MTCLFFGGGGGGGGRSIDCFGAFDEIFSEGGGGGGGGSGFIGASTCILGGGGGIIFLTCEKILVEKRLRSINADKQKFNFLIKKSFA
ncbi:MAG: hypothetical protein E6H06_10135 [Bacteroidetes bacterium]|nr:MAG: hypothetical protein E6H06_10135 [Bacteroidota bacterium]